VTGVPSPLCNLRRPASPDDAPELLRAWLGPLVAALPDTVCLPLAVGPDPAALSTARSPDAPGIRIPRSGSPPVWRAASPPSSRVSRVASTAALRLESSQIRMGREWMTGGPFISVAWQITTEFQCPPAKPIFFSGRWPKPSVRRQIFPNFRVRRRRLTPSNGALRRAFHLPLPAPRPSTPGQEGGAAAGLRLPLQLLPGRGPRGHPAVVRLSPRRHRRFLIALLCSARRFAGVRDLIVSWCSLAQWWELAWPEGKPARCPPAGGR